MTEFYDYLLHKNYEQRFNNEINIKEKIFNAIEDFLHLELDFTVYPNDQYSLLYNRFPLAGNRTFPDLQMSDYIMCINNYRDKGNLFTLRYVHPEHKYCELLFLNPNENGQIWLLIISPEFKEIEEVKKYANVNLTNDTVQ